MPISKRISFILPLALATLSKTAWASDYHSARTLALGGSGHAGPSLTDALYLNPSFASFRRAYSISLSYMLYKGDDGANPALELGRLLNGTLLDCTADVAQAGLGYTTRNDANIVTLGASRAIMRQWGVGVGGKIIFTRDGSGDVIRDATLSTSVIATDWLHLVAIVDNLVESNESRDRGFYREYTFGTKVNVMGIMMLYFDPHLAPSAPGGDGFGHEMGMELAPLSDVFLRFGQFRNASLPYYSNARGTGYSLGAGWMGPRLTIDYGFSHVTSPQPATIQTLALSVFF